MYGMRQILWKQDNDWYVDGRAIHAWANKELGDRFVVVGAIDNGPETVTVVVCLRGQGGRQVYHVCKSDIRIVDKSLSPSDNPAWRDVTVWTRPSL